MQGNMQANVLIVGAGPTGLSLAFTLAQNGVRVRVIEKDSAFHIGRKGVGIQLRSQELHKMWGTLDDVLEYARPIPPIHIYGPGKREPVKTMQLDQAQDPTPTRPYGTALTLSQSKHQEIFQDHLARYGVPVEFATELTGIEDLGDRVLAHLKKSDHLVEAVAFDWVIGADGGRSFVRKQIGIPFLGETRDSGFIITGDIQIRKGLDREYTHVWGDNATKLLGLFPSEMPGQIFSFYLSGAQLDEEKETIVNGGKDELVKNFCAITGRDDVEYGELVWISLWTPNIRMVESFSKGRVFLAGDACHCHAPTGGQGLNSGLQDAINLGWKLSLVQKGYAPPSLLDTYTTERVPVIAAMLDKSTLLFNRAFARTDTPQDGRNFERGREIGQLGVNYCWSSIVSDDFTPKEADTEYDPYGTASLGQGPVQAGMRAPDSTGLVSVRGTQRLFDVFGTSYHTILIFDQDLERRKQVIDVLAVFPPELFRVFSILPQGNPQTSEDTLVDSEGVTYEAYEAKDEKRIVVVRPDSWIGAVVKDAEGVKRYIGSIFL